MPAGFPLLTWAREPRDWRAWCQRRIISSVLLTRFVKVFLALIDFFRCKSNRYLWWTFCGGTCESFRNASCMIKRLSCCFIVMDVKVCRHSPLQILFHYCARACFFVKGLLCWRQSREKNEENGQVLIPAAWLFLEGSTEKLSHTLDSLHTLEMPPTAQPIEMTFLWQSVRWPAKCL